MTKAKSDHHILHPLEGPEWQLWAIVLSKIIAKAWIDDGFKKQFQDEPAHILSKHGLNIPDGMSIEVSDGATEWSMSGSALTGACKFILPIPPKPDVDDILKGWAEGELGHPPVLSAVSGIAFSGFPGGDIDAAARRVAEARRVGEGRRVAEGRRAADARRVADDSLGLDAAARRVTEARRVIDDDEFSAIADAAARRIAEARRITDHPGIEAIIDAAARRVAEARRVTEDGETTDPADSAGRRTAAARRLVDDTEETQRNDASARRAAEGRRVAGDENESDDDK